jgi:two-component system phosphate regulon sensor histidine kinase PhoR
MREGVMVLSENMRITAFNIAAAEAFSHPDHDLRGRRLSEVIRDFSLHEAFESAIKHGRNSELRIELLGEEVRIFNVFVSPLDLKFDRESVAIGVFYEITRVEKLERVRQEFLSNISHELRTPLTSILAFVETLEDGAIDDAQNNRRFLEVIRKNAQRMQELVEDFSELSSIEAREVKVDPKRIEVSVIASDTLASLSAFANERSVELLNMVPDDSYVTADKLRLQQMLTNLVDNAIKFNREGGTVTITFEEEAGNDVICVQDTGSGISKEQQQRIFERFYRIDSARSREAGGTGLGLAIVKHLARLHNGEVTVKSVASVGTTFRISLPRL